MSNVEIVLAIHKGGNVGEKHCVSFPEDVADDVFYDLVSDLKCMERNCNTEPGTEND